MGESFLPWFGPSPSSTPASAAILRLPPFSASCPSRTSSTLRIAPAFPMAARADQNSLVSSGARFYTSTRSNRPPYSLPRTPPPSPFSVNSWGMIVPPVLGVRPPIASALAVAGAKDVAVLGVRSIIQSPELRAYADVEAGRHKARVHLVDASPLVDLVESGTFLFAPEKTQDAVNAFLDDLDGRYPNVATATLSSTHLPWLRSYLEKARPGRPLLDPLEDAIAEIKPHAVLGTGKVLGLVTEGERYKAADFRLMLDRLGVSLPLHTVRL